MALLQRRRAASHVRRGAHGGQRRQRTQHTWRPATGKQRGVKPPKAAPALQARHCARAQPALRASDHASGSGIESPVSSIDSNQRAIASRSSSRASSGVSPAVNHPGNSGDFARYPSVGSPRITMTYGRFNSSCAVRLISSSVIVVFLTRLRERFAYVVREDMWPAVGNHNTALPTAEDIVTPAHSLEVVAAQLQVAPQFLEAHGVRPLRPPPPRSHISTPSPHRPGDSAALRFQRSRGFSRLNGYVLLCRSRRRVGAVTGLLAVD